MRSAVAIRRIRAALTVLTLIAATALTAPPGHAAPRAGESNELNVTVEMKVTIKSDDTFDASFVITDTTDASLAPPIHAGRCNLEYFLVEPNIFAGAKVAFDDRDNKRVCTITRNGKISETNHRIRHEGDKYAIDTDALNGRKTPSSRLHLSYIATFPGEVTQSDGGKIEGSKRNTVSFTDMKGRVVKGKDRAASERTFSNILPWIIGGVGSLAVIGLITMAVVVRRRQQSSQTSPGPYPQAFSTQGSVPQPFHPGQPAVQQFPAQPSAPQPHQQQAPGQSSLPFYPSGADHSTYPPFPAQTPHQHSQWPPPPQPQ